MFQTIFYDPIYNALIFLVNGVPNGSLALAIVALTTVVAIILLPLSLKTLKNQIIQKKLQPLVQEVRAKYPNKTEQSMKLMEVYKANKTNPFTGCLTTLIQLPILLAMFRVFQEVEFGFSRLYSFVDNPTMLDTTLFGFINLFERSIFLAALVGIIQFAQIYLSPAMAMQGETKSSGSDDLQVIMMEKMQKGTKYFIPLMIFGFSLFMPAAVVLYWLTRTMFMIIQELVMKKTSKDITIIRPDTI